MPAKSKAEASLLIGALSIETGVNIETVRYYERIGLLSPPRRSQGRHRQFGAGHIQELLFIRRARELGFSLDDVRALMKLGNNRGMGAQLRSAAHSVISPLCARRWHVSRRLSEPSAPCRRTADQARKLRVRSLRR